MRAAEADHHRVVVDSLPLSAGLLLTTIIGSTYTAATLPSFCDSSDADRRRLLAA